MPIYKATYVCTSYFLANGDDDAEALAPDAIKDEIEMNDVKRDEVTHSRVRSAADVDDPDAIPWDYTDDLSDQDETIRDIFERETATNPAPAPGQLALPIDAVDDTPSVDKPPVGTLVAWKACGCASIILAERPETTAKDVKDFYKDAGLRRCTISRMPRGEEFEWECEPHKSARKARIAGKHAAKAAAK